VIRVKRERAFALDHDFRRAVAGNALHFLNRFGLGFSPTGAMPSPVSERLTRWLARPA